MTKKHYISIAEALNDYSVTLDEGQVKEFDRLLAKFCNIFKEDNNKFNQVVFIIASKLDKGS